MATEKQIAANRANAKRSTGPRTAAGRAKSSRNSYRHGLSLPVSADEPQTRAKIDMIARVIAGDAATEDALQAAMLVAEAQLDLMRIRVTRASHTPDVLDSTQALERLLVFDRYERLALSRRKFAKRLLDDIHDAGKNPLGTFNTKTA
jgi:hypothetical protein